MEEAREVHKGKLKHTEAVYEEKPDKRPMHKTGFFGLVGKKVDSLEWYPAEIEKLTAELQDERSAAKGAQGAAFAFFDSRQAAASAAQTMHVENADQWQVFPADEPRDVEWANLAIPFYERFIRTSIVCTITALTVLFYMVNLYLHATE